MNNKLLKQSIYKKVFLIERGSQAITWFIVGGLAALFCFIIIIFVVSLCIWLIVNFTQSTSSNEKQTPVTTQMTKGNTGFKKEPIDCGISTIKPALNDYTTVPSKRIINGIEAVQYSWPWAVSLRLVGSGTFNVTNHFCGGSLVC